MFPLKVRRKYPRIYKKNMKATIIKDDVEYKEYITNISAIGCCTKSKKNSDVLVDKEKVVIMFELNDMKFKVNAIKVRDRAFEFKFDNEDELESLNVQILSEYFKDTPELMPKKED